MLTINNIKYAKNDDELIESLFTSGGTANGFYKVKKNGILISNIKNEPFAFICNNNPSHPFFVSCSIEDKIFGLDKLSYIEEINLAKSIIESIKQ